VNYDLDTFKEEEGEYEEASYQPGSQAGKQEARVAPTLLVQPLITETAGEKEGQQDGSVVRLCQGASDRQGQLGPCARYTSVESWVTKHYSTC
jgi:hypothetical protein